MLVAVVLPCVALIILWLGDARNANSDILVYEICIVSVGLPVGAVLGCGGVLGIPEDNGDESSSKDT